MLILPILLIGAYIAIDSLIYNHYKMISVNIQSLKFTQSRTWLFAMMFIAGNIFLPALVHTVPGGGPTWLPIYFFTLIGAYLCGWRVGILTAILSPLINSALTGMPAVAVLPAIMIKSVLLAFAASLAARKFGKASLAAIALVIIAYQTVGSLIEWGITRDISMALQDVTMAWPGMLFQLVAGWLVIRKLSHE